MSKGIGTDAHKVLKILCEAYVKDDGYLPVPTEKIGSETGFSMAKVRKVCADLKALGYVETMRQNARGADGVSKFYSGYICTEEAYETEEYKKAYEKEIRRNSL